MFIVSSILQGLLGTKAGTDQCISDRISSSVTMLFGEKELESQVALRSSLGFFVQENKECIAKGPPFIRGAWFCPGKTAFYC